MLPACNIIAGTARFSGISGAALLTPLFLIGSPLLGVPHLTTVEAIGISLFLETSGFGAGMYRYVRMRLVDWRSALSLIVITLPLGMVGALLAYYVPTQVLRLGYGVAMLGLAWLLTGHQESGRRAEPPCPCLVCESECADQSCPEGERRQVRAVTKSYDYCASGLSLQRLFSGASALLAGLISTSVGEATLPTMVRRSRFPVPIAAATSTVVVAATVVGAAAVHLVQLAVTSGLRTIPWNLIVWAVPGAFVGALLGTRLHGRVSERSARVFFSGLYLAIGVSFLIAFTVFKSRFA